MKNLFLILVVSITSSASLLCQQVIILHIVNADTQMPIPFAIVSNLEKSNGGYANEEGVFALSESDLVNVDTLLVSAIGYQDAIVDIQELSSRDTIRLVPSDLMLSEVVVTASSLDNDDKARFIGVDKKRHNSSMSYCTSSTFGLEYAIKMKKDDISDEIDQVYIYFNRKGKSEAPFRVKIYNEKDGVPAEVLHSTIVKPKNRLKKWSPISLSSDDITKGEKIFFVAFEWLYTNEEKYTYENGPKSTCYGQVLGLAKIKQTGLFFSKITSRDDWFARQGIFDKLVPMIKVKMK